jgi:hypothetical protein
MGAGWIINLAVAEWVIWGRRRTPGRKTRSAAPSGELTSLDPGQAEQSM